MERDDILQEELKRFNQIGSYVSSLSEQMLGGIGSGSGFVKNQPSRFGFKEQEDPEAIEDDETIEVTDDELEGEIDVDAEIDGDDEIEGDTELEGDDDFGLGDEDMGDETSSDATELDVTHRNH